MRSHLLILKRLKFSTASALILFALLLSGNFAYSEPLRDTVEGEQLITLDVENMTWVGCVVAVRNSLEALEGINETEVDLDEKTAIVYFDPLKVSVAKMVKATTDVGFPSSIRQTEE